MAQSRRPLRSWVTLAAFALACSGGDGDGGTAPPVPTNMQKTGGDDQTGLPGATLPQPLEVRITDAGGLTIANHAVSFSASAGTLSPTSTTTDTQGRARSLLTLPAQSGPVTVTASAQGLPSVTFSARAQAAPMSITTPFLPAARTGVPYARALAASGGAPGATFAFSVTSGGLPAGLTLQPDGSIAGTASAAGAFPITVRVSDGQASEATQSFTLNVCDVAQPMAVGEVRTFQVSTRGSCGMFLPSGDAGARYRVTVARTTNVENGSDVAGVSFLVSGNGVTSAPVAAAAESRAPLALDRRPFDIRGFDRMTKRLEVTRREHARLLEEGEALARTLGTEGLLRAPDPSLRAAPAAVDLPGKLRVTSGTPTTCSASSTQSTAILLAQNDWLAVYQDSAQNTILSTQVSPGDAARLIELATTNGKPVIDEYFGGVRDIDGNGKVIVVIALAGSEALGKVWTGNFYRKAECPPSNEGEYVYVHWETAKGIQNDDLHVGQHVLVHELKHVSSLYQRLLRAGGGVVDSRRVVDYNPLWLEEGGAEIASELAGRNAWAQRGGPAVNALVEEAHFRLPNNEADIDTQNFGVLLMLFGAQEHLSAQPNSVVARTPGTSDSYVYSSGWLFQRWLGDAYGNAASAPFADAEFFRRLNDASTPSGAQGVEAITGRSWAQLMEEFSVAAMANGQGVPVPRGFSAYDFVSTIEMWCFAVDPADLSESGCTGQAGPPGAFPWPVTTDAQGLSQSRSFGDALIQGGAGPSGIRVHDLLSNGTGQGAEINVELNGPSLIRVLRIR
jgi:hypothetical protein